MSGLIHEYIDDARNIVVYRCPFCGERHEVSRYVQKDIRVLGEKPTVNCRCRQTPHIPPMPGQRADLEMMDDLWQIVQAVRRDHYA